MAPRIIIVESAPLIAMDLVETVSEIFPTANVRLFSTIAESVGHLCGAPDIDIAIVSQSVSNICTSQLPRLVEKSGGQIVVITPDERNIPSGWAVILQPFSTEAVASVLTNLSADRPTHPPANHIEKPAS